MKKIGILGRGTMACGIVQLFAQNGYELTMWVRSIDKDNPRASVASIEKQLDRQVSRERMTKEDMDATLERISITTDYEDLKDSDLIIEAIAEDMDLKKTSI